jgi:hypothetical protein
MQNRQRCSRSSVVNSAYADLPRPVHWALNSLGEFSLAAPHVFSLLSWFLLTWGIDMLQAAIWNGKSRCNLRAFRHVETRYIAVCVDFCS